MAEATSAEASLPPATAIAVVSQPWKKSDSAIGATIASCSWDLSLRLWDLEECLADHASGEEPRPTHVILDAHDDYILSLAHAPDIEQLASASASVEARGGKASPPAAR